MFYFGSLLQIIICQPSVRNWNFFYAWSAVIQAIFWLKFLGVFVCLFVLFFLCDCAGSWEFVWFWREPESKTVVYWIYNYISSCHKAILSRVVWRSRKADNVHLIKHSLLGWIQDCEIRTGSLNVFWESRNNLSVKLIPMTINQLGMFSNSSRKQTNGK